MSVRSRAPRLDPSTSTPPTARPRIWVEGRQRPRFDLRAYLATSQGMARRDLDPALVEAAQRLMAFGQRVQGGEVRVGLVWAGRAARVIPSHGRVGGWLIGLSQLLTDSRHLLRPDLEPEDPIAYPDLAFANPEPIPPRRTVEPTLHAIRQAIGPAPLNHAPPAVLPPAPQPRGPIGRALWAAATRVTLAILMAFALPGGAVRALLFHLDGGDLAEWS